MCPNDTDSNVYSRQILHGKNHYRENDIKKLVTNSCPLYKNTTLNSKSGPELVFSCICNIYGTMRYGQHTKEKNHHYDIIMSNIRYKYLTRFVRFVGLSTRTHINIAYMSRIIVSIDVVSGNFLVFMDLLFDIS